MSQRPPRIARAAAARRQLLRISAGLGADELAVLVLIAGRLAKGRDTYGPLHLDRDSRDFQREALEEVADGLSYSAMALVQRTRRRRRWPGAPLHLDGDVP